MSDDIQNAVKHAVEKRHLHAGDTVDKDTAMNMMNDVWKELQKDQKAYTDKPLSAATMKVAANELEHSLQKFGVKDIEFYDSNKDGKADKNDEVYVKTGYILGNQTFKLNERPAVETPTEKPPILIRTIPELKNEPGKMRIPGYDN